MISMQCRKQNNSNNAKYTKKEEKELFAGYKYAKRCNNDD
ncbi:hypothetical protein SynA1528_00179 [Synechococcus sp. A15-28]|nr:hypothetical protein SynA1528_00179 [Synechococcus sp. A15-28]